MLCHHICLHSKIYHCPRFEAAIISGVEKYKNFITELHEKCKNFITELHKECFMCYLFANLNEKKLIKGGFFFTLVIPELNISGGKFSLVEF